MIQYAAPCCDLVGWGIFCTGTCCSDQSTLVKSVLARVMLLYWHGIELFRAGTGCCCTSTAGHFMMFWGFWVLLSPSYCLHLKRILLLLQLASLRTYQKDSEALWGTMNSTKIAILRPLGGKIEKSARVKGPIIWP